MNLKEALRTMTPEEIEDWLILKMQSAEREADQIGACKLLMQRKNMIGHGNEVKKDYREVIVGSEKELKAGESSDDK